MYWYGVCVMVRCIVLGVLGCVVLLSVWVCGMWLWEDVLLCIAMDGVHELCVWMQQGRGVREAELCVVVGVILVFVYSVGLCVVVHGCV